MFTRRAFLKAGGLALFTAGAGGSPLFLARAAEVASSSGPLRRRRVLVAIFQRGAMDGLMAVAPFTDPLLAQYRPRLGMSAAKSAGDAGLIDLDGRFGLHPAFGPLESLYREKRLAIVHGVGSPDQTRSHFDAQDYMETGTPGVKGTRSGWLNRAVGLMGHEASTPFRAVAMTAAMPKSLYGDEPALAIARLQDFTVQVPVASLATSTKQSFEELYGKATQALLHDAGRESFDAMHTIATLNVNGYRPAAGALYPVSPLGSNLKQIAQLIKADVGLEVAFAETGGWDTHVQQGNARGTFARRAVDLAQAIGAFWTDLADRQDDVALMTMTEFGRTAHENGSGGTDHGRASCQFILANRVDGGKVHGTVPSLALENLDSGRDLPVTTDFRAVFSDIAGTHLNVSRDAMLFPGWTGERFPVMKA